MFPTRLNLLSPQKQNGLRHLIYAQYTRQTLESALLVLSICGIILLSGQGLLQGYFTNVITNLISLSNRQTGDNTAIKRMNNTITKTQTIQQIFTLWTPVMLEITARLPPHVVLTSLQLDAASKTYILFGLAGTRDELLAFQTNLQNMPQIKQVSLPISALTEKENIFFTITATLQ